jgi:hypothetical protein
MTGPPIEWRDLPWWGKAFLWPFRLWAKITR